MSLHHFYLGNLTLQVPSVDASRSIEFDGIDESIDFTNYPNFDIDDAFTLATWIKPNNTNSTFASKIELPGKDGILATITVGGDLRFDIQLAPGDNILKIQHSVSTDDSTWYHVVMTYDGNYSSPDMQIYLNGFNPGGATTGSATGTETILTTDPYRLGRRNVPHYAGKIAGHSVYDSVLSSADVARIYSRGVAYDLQTDPTSTNLVKWMYFNTSTDLESANGVVDTIGNGDGTAVNMTNAVNLVTDMPS